MIFDGVRWTVCSTVAPLPESMWAKPHHVDFGKIVTRNTKGSVKTDYKWYNSLPRKFAGKVPPPPDGTEFFDNGTVCDYWCVYARPIKSIGHALTNMAIAENGARYLLYKGTVYMRGAKAR